MQDAVMIRTDEQLAQIVRLGSILRMPRLELMLQAGASFCSMNDLTQRVSSELGRYHENLQLYHWHIGASGSFGGIACQINTHYYDGGEDRLFVRRHVYSRASALCSRGRPEPGAIYRTVMRDIAYGYDSRNPHCVSSALQAHNGVCQAIAHYLFQLMLRCGYPCVIRTGTVNGTKHSWNQVFINGAWRSVDVCVGGAVEYRDETPVSPEKQYGAMTACLDRQVRLHARGADVGGVPTPFYIADRHWICPTRFVQCFNGAYFMAGNELVVCMGAVIRRIPLAALRETPEHMPYMETERFARLMGLRLENDSLLFTEGL